MAVLRNLAFELSGAQLGITVSSLLLGFVAELLIAPALADPLGGLGLLPQPGAALAAVSVGVLVFLSFAQMIAGELVPKNFAIARPLQMTLLLAPLLGASNRLARPLVNTLNQVANSFIRLAGLEPADELSGVRTSADLLRAIHWSSLSGVLPSSTSRLAQAVIAFDSIKARDVLTPRSNVVFLSHDATMAELAQTASQHGIDRVPVLDGASDELLGVVNARALLSIARGDLASIPIRLYLQPALTVPIAAPLYSVLLNMRAQQNPLAIAVDEHGVMAGVLSIEDVLLPLLAGRAKAAPGQLTRRAVIVDGSATASDCQLEIGFDLPVGPYETLAGFLLMGFQRIPTAGDVLEHQGWHFEVLATDGMRITRVLANRPRQSP